VNEVEVAPNGKVWFGSCAHNLGGLMCYDNGTFSLYTPENSMLNQHVIQKRLKRQLSTFVSGKCFIFV